MLRFEYIGPVVWEIWSRLELDAGLEHRGVYAVATNENNARNIADTLNEAVIARRPPFTHDARLSSQFAPRGTPPVTPPTASAPYSWRGPPPRSPPPPSAPPPPTPAPKPLPLTSTVKAGTWRSVLGFAPKSLPSFDDITQSYRVLARLHHPDAGGSHDRMAIINNARDKAMNAAKSWSRK